MSADTKHVYYFGGKEADGGTTQKNLLGGKGANLAEMVNIGLPVPAGFTITTEVCNAFYDNNQQYPDGLKEQVEAALKKVEAEMGAEFGSKTNPLLLSCRSGARESMPGMMDTVLNIGLNDETVEVLAEKSGNAAFAWDSYRRFIQMYSDVVMEVRPEGKEEDFFEEILDHAREAAGVEFDSGLSVDQLKEVVAKFKAVVLEKTGKSFPTEAIDQLWGAVSAVFSSWMNDRAMVYRRQYSIPHNWGTAVNVQAMVYGNLGDDCATGVGLTRDCSMGVPGFQR